MVHEFSSPHALAEAVYRALQSGTKLPPLNDSEELRSVLLTFEPSVSDSNTDTINRNKGSSGGTDSSGGNSTISKETHKQDISRREDGLKRRLTGSSVLMLEALSRRRMDAVRQLHEVCPELLASIPLFDRRPSVGLDSVSPIANTSQLHSHTIQSSSDSVSSSVMLTPNTCLMHRSSHLLDLAAENQTLLVFVLQQHPQVSLQRRAGWLDSEDKLPSARSQLAKKCDCYDTMGSPHAISRFDVGGTPWIQQAAHHTDNVAQKTSDYTTDDGSECTSPAPVDKENVKKEEKGDTLADLDPNSPVTICIHKDNAEVLQYLLFKHVWQHFLLDEIFHLPHNSYVPDFPREDLVHTCPECPWFLHCAALMGCSHLLHLVLCGQFCHHPGLMSMSPVLSDPDSIKSNTEGAAVKAETGVQSLTVNQEVCQNQSDERSEKKRVDGDTAASIVIDEGGKDTQVQDHNGQSDERSGKNRVSGDTTPSVVIDVGKQDTPVPDHNEAMAEAISSSASHAVANVPLPLESSEVHSMPVASGSRRSSKSVQTIVGLAVGSSTQPGIASSSQKPGKQLSGKLVASDARRSLIHEQQSTAIPDPNKMFPVSLPIMDRWISRCMHVKLTPLHLACWRCDPASIKVLLHHGADVHILAEELLTSEVEKGGNTTDSTSMQATGAASSESSSVELNLNFVSVTVNSSSLDLSTVCNSMEEMLKRAGPDKECWGLSPLAMLALGIRSPPDFSLSIGKSLGLVLPTLSESWGGQVDRSCVQAKNCLLEALHLLLDAGCDVNTSSLVFGKMYRVMELFLQPSVDLYYAPLMPRGGRDSAVLRCMDLERVAEIVLSACWELCTRGAKLGPDFSSCLEWNLFRMDWMFLQSETLQKRFLHLAIFLGLFPPLDPALFVGSSTHRQLGKVPAAYFGSEESQNSVDRSVGSVDLHQPYSLPPRPSCIPWAPSTSRVSSLSQSYISPSDSEETLSRDIAPDNQRPQQPTEVVTSYYSTVGTQVRMPKAGSSGVEHVIISSENSSPLPQSIAESIGIEPALSPEVLSQVPQSVPDNSMESYGPHLSDSGHYMHDYQRSEALSSEVSSQVPQSISDNSTESCGPHLSGPGHSLHGSEAQSKRSTSTTPDHTAGPSSTMRMQMAVWALEERQRKCLEKFVNDAIRLSMSQSCLMQILQFLCLPDLHLLTSITQHMLNSSTVTTETPLQCVSDSVSQAQFRTLQHSCKLVILLNLRWRSSAVHCLPLPESLKRYLLDPN